VRTLLLVAVALAISWAAGVQAQGGSAPGGNATNVSTTENPPPTNASANNTTSAPAPAGPITISLEGHGDNGQFFWTLAGQSDHNPTITVQPGQQVTFHVTAVSSVHNFKIGDNKPTSPISEGDSVDVSWTAPAAPGTVTYICTIHGQQMSGTIQVGNPAGGPQTSGGVGDGEIVGSTVRLGDYYKDPALTPTCADEKIPAIVTRGVTGGPTLSDYAKWCETGGNPPRPPSSADFVIPISFGVIGLGVLGVVWAHRVYKP
jgi:hypothetical protein